MNQKTQTEQTRTKLDLSAYGIQDVQTIHHNLSYDELYKHETNPELEGFEKGFETDTGAVAVDTGIFTGRSPKDKYIVRDDESQKNIWWAGPNRKGSDNKPISKEVWNDLLDLSQQQLTGKTLYVTDAYCGANENTRIKIRVISEVAWVSHFVKNMFITPTEEELECFEPDFVMLHACKTVNPKWEDHNLNSDVYVAFNIQDRMAVVGGTWYGGEIKKGFFSIMNYFLPLQGMAAMHCSANMGEDGDTAIFFGLSGTGKTTLSADPNRNLIGDDEHGWDNDGVFNFEGGCYAKTINLSKEKEPDIYNAIRRDALLENVVFDENTGEINFADATKTENTRVSYPIYHIRNIVKPVSKGGHPKNIIFLSADAFGVLPPVAKLTRDQTMYYFLSGYTAKLAGTERGIKEPLPTFSSAFGAAFLLLHPTVYAQELAKKMMEHGSEAWLVNTGWIGGPYGVGKRIDLPVTRQIIDSILDGSLSKMEFERLPIFDLFIPKNIPDVDSSILNPRNLWKYPSAYDKQAQDLADKFISNFENFTDNEEGKRLVAAGPKSKLMQELSHFFENKIREVEAQTSQQMDFLKSQINDLQDAFNEYANFNSFDEDFKIAALTRYLPVEIYIRPDGNKGVPATFESLNKLIDEMGFEIGLDIPTDDKCTFGKFIAKSKQEFSAQDVREKIEELEVLLKTEAAGLTETVKSNGIVSAAISLVNYLRSFTAASIKIGSLLIVKVENSKSGNFIKVKILNNRELLYLEKNQALLQKPNKLFKELKVLKKLSR